MKFIIKHRNFFPLGVIVVLGAILRLWNLGSLPVSLNWDEVSHGYNAFSILKTGMDEWGKHFPLIFRAFGDYKLPLNIYLSTIPVYLFGLSAFSVRFISALSGIFAILGIFLLTRELLPGKKIRYGKFSIPLEIITAFILSISPWHFFISRPALEANLALTLIIFGFYFLLRFFGSSSSLIPSVLLLGLSLHTYNTARVFVPLLVVIAFIIFRPSLQNITANKIKNILAGLLAIGFFGLVVLQVFAGEGTARYEKLKILSPATVFQIGEARTQNSLPPFVARLMHNRPVYFFTTVTKNYLGYFSPAFFYQTWGAQFQFAIPKQNLLTLPVYLLSILGLLSLLTMIKGNKNHQFLLTWLFLSPIAASLTSDPPQALRPNPLIPALLIIASLGLYFLLGKLSKKYTELFFIALLVWIVSSFALYFYRYNTEYKVKYSSSWQYGYSQVMDFIKEHGSEYEKVFITKKYGEPHIFYAFYTKLAPQKIQPGGDNLRFEKSDWYWTDKIDNVYFVNYWKIPKITVATLQLESGEVVSTARSLLITSPEHVPINAHVIKTINFLDDSPAFIITSIP